MRTTFNRGKLIQYINSTGVSIQEFATMCGVSMAYIYMVDKDPEKKISLVLANQIFQATKEKFGEGLGYWEYTNIPRM